MRPTRRWWTLVGVGVVLLVVAILGEQPLPLVGAAVIGGYCLVAASRAVAAFTTTHEAIDVEVETVPQRVPVGGDTTLTVTVSAAAPLSHPVTVDCTFPPSVDSDPVRLTLTPGETRARERCSPSFPVAGRFEFPTLSLEYESPDGLFVETVPVDESVTLSAEAHGTGDVHVGAGGTPIRGLFGSHTGDTTGVRGDDLASIRQYQPGDSVRRVDWKTTARLDEPHVREYEVEYEQATRIVIDARAPLTAGTPGRTKLDYLREVALGVLRSAEAGDDPLALTVVDETGIRVATESASTDDQYRRIRETLLGLGQERPETTTTRPTSGGTTGPADAHRSLQVLTSRRDDSAFATTLTPFFERTGSYVARLSEDALFEAVRRHTREASRGTWTVLLTDDSAASRLLEATKLATRGNGRATVFVTPSVLFERHDVVDLETAYQGLVEFEEFRRRLERLPRAAAYEVAPDDRLRAVLAQGADRARRRSRRRQQSTRGSS